MRTDPIEYAFDDMLASKRTETVRITGTREHGIATIYDQDLLIFVISQLDGSEPRRGCNRARRITFHALPVFRVDRKRTPRAALITRLREALLRLRTTNIETTIRSASTQGGTESSSSRGFPRWAQWRRTEKSAGIEVVLAEWLYESVQDFHVLTLDKRYFDIAGPVERWLYLYARKATGGAVRKWMESFQESLCEVGIAAGLQTLRQYPAQAGEEKQPSWVASWKLGWR